MTRLLCVLSALVVVLSFAPLTYSQRKGLKDDKREKEGDASSHELWFLEGRMLPDGTPAAKYVTEAHKQKMALRKANAVRIHAARAAGATTPGAASGGSVWMSMGPSPIADDQTYGPVGGRVTAVAVDPTDATGNTVYIGGAFGGLWKSTNAATATDSNVIWTPLIDQQVTLAAGAIAVKPTDGNVVLVGTGENKRASDSYYGLGILRSTDGGTTWTQITGDQEGHSFIGVGFGRIAFSTANPNLVVASTGIPAKGSSTGVYGPTSRVGLYYSTDAGATWHASTMSDGVLEYAHSVIYNVPAAKFYASVRYHGIYSSPDGTTWTRLATQPNSGVLTIANCPTSPNSSACPFYRGELAARSDVNDMYVWYSGSTTADSGNGGVWRSRDGGASWTALDKTDINNCDAAGDAAGTDACGVYQAYFYNMYIGVAPNASNSAATDVYIGAGNIMKCTVDAAHPTCATGNANPYRFMNLTRVYGCGNNWGQLAHVHPDQHHIAFVSGHANIVYFVNDGGVYRTLNSGGLNDDSCSATLPFDNLNNYPLSLTQFVWGTPHPTDPTAFMGGAQDVGTSIITSSTWGSTQKLWQPLPVGGDGGYNTSSGNYLLQSWNGPSINICNVGLNCPTAFTLANWNIDFVNASTVGGDESAFYMPWILDPLDNTKVLLGTCRIWRGAVSFSSPFAGTALSPRLSDNVAGTCTTEPLVYSLAAGGPAAASGTSSVIYASIYRGSSASNVSKIFMTAASDTGNWVERTPPPSLNPGPNWNSNYPFKISALWVDPSVGSGLTVYATVQGFKSPHVLKSTNGGLAWTNITGDLPDAPVNNITADPDDASIIYVGTDTGVYVTTNNGANWVEVGPSEPGGASSGYLPNVPVTRVTIFKSASAKYLYAVTYGRGVWKVDFSAPLTVASVTASPSQTTISAGSSKTFTISASAGGWATNSISFSCTELPANSTCSFNPTSVAPGSNTTLTIATTRTGSTSLASENRRGRAPLLAFWLGLPAMVLLPFAGTKLNKRFAAAVVTLSVSLLLMFGATSCGGGGGGSSSVPIQTPIIITPAGTYTVQVVATSGATSQSTPISVTVQ